MSKEKDWLDEWFDSLPEEEQREIENKEATYYWDHVDESLYCLDGEPLAWNPVDKKWVWSDDAAGILVGKGFAKKIDKSEVQKYKDFLEKELAK